MEGDGGFDSFFSVLLTNMSLNTSFSPVTLENGHDGNQTHGNIKMKIQGECTSSDSSNNKPL